MHTLKRYALACGFASGTTLALFWVMQGMIEPGGEIIEDPPTALPLEFVRLIEDEPLVTTPPPKPPVKPVEPPPTLIPVSVEIAEGGTGEAIGLEPPVIGGTPPLPGRNDGEYIPVLTAAPDYPDSAARKGLEGYVIIEYTVDEKGSVQDPHVIFAEPMRVFDRAALKAVQRYKYKPRVVDGRAVQVHGVRQRITFELTG